MHRAQEKELSSRINGIGIPAERKIVIARDIKFLEQTSNDRDENLNKKPEVEMNIRSEKPKEVLIETGISTSVDQSMPQPMVPSNQGLVLRPGRELLHPSTSGNGTVKRGPGRPRFLRTGTRGRPRKQYKMSNEAVEGNEDTEEEENEEHFSTPVGSEEELEDDVFVGFVGTVEMAV